jgi:hypothetical protein
MATTFGFKDIIDLPQWRPNAPLLASAVAGCSFAYDMRNDASRHPYLYWLRSATALDLYDPTTDGWVPLASPTLAGTFGAGACAVFHPSQGPRGTLAAGSTTTSITLTTALPAAVATNQLANRGDGVGFKIRILGNATGSSGKVEEHVIVGNTAGTTPTIYLDSALSFTPLSGDGYEILSGRVFMLSAGTLASGVWKYYDVATNSYSAALGYTNLPATIGTESAMVALSELYVPNDKAPGGGYFGSITASASSSTSITGSGLPSLFADEYRNFQVRIVQDTVTPTAVGQRRRITTHTSGASPVFTVAAWTVTPSSSAVFVVENDDDKVLLRTSSSANVYTYNITAATWDTTTFGASGSAVGAGTCFMMPFGVTRDSTGSFRHSKMLCIRGGGSAAIDELDIAAATTGTWASDIVYGAKAQTFTTGTCATYGPVTRGGRLWHINVNGGQTTARFDARNRVMDAETYIRYPQGTAHAGERMAIAPFVDGTDKLGFVYMATTAGAPLFSLAIQR